MKKMFTIIMGVVMMLMVADVRLTANAAEVAATTVEAVVDVNGDGEVNTKDAEAIIDDLINNPNTQYCVADWVRVSKIVEEKIGPAICGYDVSEMDVTPQNNEIINRLVDSDLKVKMDENVVTFTRSEENATEVFKFDSCEANPSANIDHIGSFTAVNERGDVQFFELGSRNGHYVLSKGLSAPIVCGSLGIKTRSVDESMDGEDVFFSVKIRGNFSCRGCSYDEEHPLEYQFATISKGSSWISDDWVLDDITYYYGKAPMYEITALDIPEGVKIVKIYNDDIMVTENDTITGVLGKEMTECVFVYETEKNFSELEVNSQNSILLEKLIDSKELKVNNDNGKIVFMNNEETFQFDSCEDSPSGNICYIGSFTAVDGNGDILSFDVGRRGKHYVLLRGLSAPISFGRLVVSARGLDDRLDGYPISFEVRICGDFSYGGVSYTKEEPLDMKVVAVAEGQDWISKNITYVCCEAPTYIITAVDIPEEMKFVYAHDRDEWSDTNYSVTGVVGERTEYCMFCFESKDNSSSIQASFEGFEVGKDVTVKLSIVGDFTFAGKTYSEEKPFEKLMTFYIPLCGLDPSYIHWETSDISWEAGTPAPMYAIEVIDIDGTPVEDCVFEGTLAENDGTRVIISNTTNR